MQAGEHRLPSLVGHDALAGGFPAGLVDLGDPIGGGDGVPEKDGLQEFHLVISHGQNVMAAVHPRHAADGGAQAEGEAAVDQAGPIGHPFAVLLVHMGGEQISNDPGKEVHITLGKGLGEGELFSDFKMQASHAAGLPFLPQMIFLAGRGVL